MLNQLKKGIFIYLEAGAKSLLASMADLTNLILFLNHSNLLRVSRIKKNHFIQQKESKSKFDYY